MRALVVYESMFGNTRDIAEAVAAGMNANGVATEVIEVGEAPRALEPSVSLLVVGAPTHAFGLSRVSTRADAAEKTDRPLISPGIGLREWFDGIGSGQVIGAAAFSTRVRKPGVPGSAAKALNKRLARAGLRRIRPPEDFWVDGMEGPLLPGELERAHVWGADIAHDVASTTGPVA